MKKDQEEKYRTYSKEDIEEANQKLEQHINSCSAEVFRSFLPTVSERFEVVPYENRSGVSDSVAYFRISKFVENEEEQMTDCLKSVYHVLAGSGNGAALVIHRKQKSCEIGLAVGNPTGSSERTIKDTERLKDAFKGNFPGSICSEIFTDSDISSSLFAQISSKYSSSHGNSLAIVSNVATEFSEDYSTQGIEKLLDGIRPSGPDSEYTLLILGEAMRENDLNAAKESLFKNYTAISPFVSETKNVSFSEAKQTNWNWNVIFSGHSWGETTGEDHGTSVEVTNYKAKHTLDLVEKQMERLEESAALGLWYFAAYVISPDLAVTNEAAHMFMSLTQGRDSFAEKSAINIWNGQEAAAAAKISEILNSLRYLRHPEFCLEKDQNNRVTATTIVSGAELARSLSFPQKSVPGFPVFKCARFGRNISTYDNHSIDPVEIGQIYHMRQPENTTVSLDKNSLSSHVFITGSTGAGKSNTIFQLLKNTNVPFLVIEPAKGEYKNVFGGDKDVRVLGTNPKFAELLRINPFSFPKNISVSEHVDRIVELFNVCWPMYAAMPSILKDAVIKAYESAGWDLELSENRYDSKLFPTFVDVLYQIRRVLNSSEYSADNKSDYTGALVTRLRSLTNGINGQIFSANEIPDNEIFDSKVIVDLSRIGSTETKAMIMGLLVMKLQEYRLSESNPDNRNLNHITVLEEAHNVLKRTSAEQTAEGANLLGKSVEMLANAIAELRSFGEGFIIADQAPGLLDMAVIRNTNTKIIHRLPDLADRELAGKAAGLNDEQIEELAKLELGVAAIYQNDWIEPVLCKAARFCDSEKQPYRTDDVNHRLYLHQDRIAGKMVQEVLLKPHEYIKVDMTLILKSNLPAQIKSMMIQMNKGQKITADVMAKAFYMLYPEIRLDFRKDKDGKYLNTLQAEISEHCGQLSAEEMKTALHYLVAVSCGLSRIGTEEYTEIREELTAHDSSDCRNCC